MKNLMAQVQKDPRGAQNRSNHVKWNEPIVSLQSMSQGPKPGWVREMDGQELNSHRAAKWTTFWRKMWYHGGKKVHAARTERVIYDDSHSYAMNFQEDKGTPPFSSRQMPTISGPGSRQIATVFLTRSPITQRNLGSTLIPNPIILSAKQETNVPLWRRRRVPAPASLLIRKR